MKDNISENRISQHKFDTFLIAIEEKFVEKANQILHKISIDDDLDDGVVFDRLSDYPDLRDAYLQLFEEKEFEYDGFFQKFSEPYIFISSHSAYISKQGKILFNGDKNKPVGVMINSKKGIREEVYPAFFTFRSLKRPIKENGELVYYTRKNIPIIFQKQVSVCSSCKTFFVHYYLENLAKPGLPPNYCPDCVEKFAGKIRTSQKKNRNEKIMTRTNPDALFEVYENPDDTRVNIRLNSNKRIEMNAIDYFLTKFVNQSIKTEMPQCSNEILICKNCGKSLPLGSRKSRTTCSNACRMQLYRKQRKIFENRE